jgi:hypothetical protein
MKRLIAVLMCMVVIGTLLAVSRTPVAAASATPQTGTLTVTGGRADYLVQAGWSTSTQYWGSISVTLTASYWTTPTVTIGAGVDWNVAGTWWMDIDMHNSAQISCSALPGRPNPVKLGVYYSNKSGITYPSEWRVDLRIVLEGLLNTVSAQCWTYQLGASLTTDTQIAAELKSKAQALGLLDLLHVLMEIGVHVGML